MGKNIGFIFTTEGVSSQKILIFHYLNERVSAANEWVYVVKYQYFLWTNDWGSENKTNILTHEWDINIIVLLVCFIVEKIVYSFDFQIDNHSLSVHNTRT